MPPLELKLAQPDLYAKLAENAKEYPNQIVFEDKETKGSCNGSLMFDKEEKLVWANRIFAAVTDVPAIGERIDGLELARALTKAFDTLFSGQPTTIDKSEVRFASADLEAHRNAGPKGYGITDFVTSGGRTLRFEVNEGVSSPQAGEAPIRIAKVSVEIGDFREADQTAVPVKPAANH
jgi:hypothetical protein